MRKKCRYRKCPFEATVKGFCTGHYQQSRAGRGMSALFSKRRPNGPPRILTRKVRCKVKGLKGPCHVFKGYVSKKDGYARVGFRDEVVLVHRYVWERDIGPIPKRRVLDHRCRNRACSNTDHLRVVTRRVNVTENVVGVGWQINLAKTHCPKGHKYTEENTRRYKSRRHCRACARERSLLSYHSKKGKNG